MSQLLGEDPNAETRRRELMALRASTDPHAGERVIEALADPDWRVRKEAIYVGEALARRVMLVPRLLEVISTADDVGLRNAALELLGRIGQTALDIIVDSLGQVPSNARKFVVAAIGEAGRPEDVPVLERVMDDADPNVAAAAIEAVARIGGTTAERVLRLRLTNPDPFQRVAALDGLDRLRARVPYDEIAGLATERLTRKVAIQVLGRTADPRAVALVSHALADPQPAIVAASAIALSRLHDDPGDSSRLVAESAPRLSDKKLEMLRLILRQGDPVSRQGAARLLVLARDERAIDGIVDLAAKDVLTVKELLALKEWGPKLVPRLLATPTDGSGKAKAVALELAAYIALGSEPEPPPGPIGDQIRTRLRSALLSKDPEERCGAARAMLQWAEGVDANALTEAIRMGPDDVSRAAGQALEALADRNHMAVRDSLAPVRLDGPGGAAFTSVVARLPDENVVARLRTALAADDPATRRSAIDGLALVGGPEAADAVGIALTDDHPEVQATAARVLGRMRDGQGRPIGVDRLLHALEAEDLTVRAAAARALGHTRDSRARKPLETLVASPAHIIAAAAIEGLRGLGDVEAAAVVASCLTHEDEEVAKQALWAVSEFESGETVVPKLGRALVHPAWDVRQLAAMLLGETREFAALAPLRERLAVEDYDLVRDAILDAVTILEGPP